jgi:hypothetical protein
MSEIEELRAAVADAYRLPRGSEAFLAGTTVDELEENASRFANLLGTTHEQKPKPNPDPAQGDPLGHILAHHHTEKHRRQRALVAALHGRPEQPRDATGRFVAGFDGGARAPFPQRRSPEEEHDEVILDLARLAQMYGRRM